MGPNTDLVPTLGFNSGSILSDERADVEQSQRNVPSMIASAFRIPNIQIRMKNKKKSRLRSMENVPEGQYAYKQGHREILILKK
jgi:hypothetical protein